MTLNDNFPILAEKGIIISTEYERYLYVLCDEFMLKLTAPWLYFFTLLLLVASFHFGI